MENVSSSSSSSSSDEDLGPISLPPKIRFLKNDERETSGSDTESRDLEFLQIASDERFARALVESEARNDEIYALSLLQDDIDHSFAQVGDVGTVQRNPPDVNNTNNQRQGLVCRTVITRNSFYGVRHNNYHSEYDTDSDDTETARQPRSLSAAEIDLLPTKRYSKSVVPAARGDGHSSNGDEYSVDSCIICASEYSPRELIRTLPCLHDFHCKCIDKWLKKKNVCPLCRSLVDLLH